MTFIFQVSQKSSQPITKTEIGTRPADRATVQQAKPTNGFMREKNLEYGMALWKMKHGGNLVELATPGGRVYYDALGKKFLVELPGGARLARDGKIDLYASTVPLLDVDRHATITADVDAGRGYRFHQKSVLLRDFTRPFLDQSPQNLSFYGLQNEDAAIWKEETHYRLDGNEATDRWKAEMAKRENDFKVMWTTSFIASVADYIGFSMANFDPDSIKIYRIFQQIDDALLIGYNFLEGSWRSALGYKIIWWTFGHDWGYYMAAETPLSDLMHAMGFDRAEGPGSLRRTFEHGAGWAYWTAKGVLDGFKRDEWIPGDTLTGQALIGVLIASVLTAGTDALKTDVGTINMYAGLMPGRNKPVDGVSVTFKITLN